jgi:acyl-CoA synthetase (AMP-forming)/AMP-acid ligase II
MQGLMMDVPLLISSLIRHAARYHGDTEIVTRTVEGPIHRYTWGDAYGRVQQLANALKGLGVQPGDRVATLAWNTAPAHRGLVRDHGHRRGPATPSTRGCSPSSSSTSSTTPKIRSSSPT